MLQRRQLDFRSAADVIAEVERLETSGYEMCGKWNLAQIADHLTRAMQNALEGPQLPSSFLLRLAGAIFGRGIFKSRKMFAGADAPPMLVPQIAIDSPEVVARLKAMALRVEAYEGAWPPHFVLGTLTPAQWKELQWIHSAHHLSFLVPKQ